MDIRGKYLSGRPAVAVGVLLLAMSACSSSSPPSRDGPSSDGNPVDHTTETSNGADAGLESGDADGSQDGSVPSVVASLGAIPQSLALSADVLYVTVAATSTGHDGKVVTVSKSALNATPDGGVTMLAGGLNQPGAVAVSGDRVFWADTGTAFPNFPDIVAVPVAGGMPTEIVSNGTTMTRLPIANSVVYPITADNQAISAVPLSSSDAGAGQVVYPPHSPNGVVTPDSDGTSVFFFTNGTKNLDLLKVPVGGGTVSNLVMDATSGSVNFDFLVDDASTVYWSDSGSGSVFSVPKVGGTKSMLATFVSGSAAVQLALDGDNIYALSSYQLARLPKAGGTPVVLASVSGGGSDRYLAGPVDAVALAVDDAFVYWLYEGHSQILKMAK
jgi:hypothetical protein